MRAKTETGEGSCAELCHRSEQIITMVLLGLDTAHEQRNPLISQSQRVRLQELLCNSRTNNMQITALKPSSDLCFRSHQRALLNRGFDQAGFGDNFDNS